MQKRAQEFYKDNVPLHIHSPSKSVFTFMDASESNRLEKIHEVSSNYTMKIYISLTPSY